DGGGLARREVAPQEEPGDGPKREESNEREDEAAHGSMSEREPHVRRSPTRWSLSRFVVPRTHIGEPEMMTITSLARTAPSPSRVASTSSIISSVVSTFRMSRDVTPHERAG